MTATLTRPAAATADSRPVRLAPLDILSLGLLGIRARTMRAALSALGISIGIATVIVVTGIPASSQKALMNQLSALGTNMLQAVPVPDQKPPVRRSVSGATAAPWSASGEAKRLRRARLRLGRRTGL